MTDSIAWIAVDWGTTSLRVWAMSAGGEILDHRTSDDGMGGLTPEEFGPVLDRLTDGWDPAVAVVACGMVGSRQGWVEAPYQTVPCRPFGSVPVRAPGEKSVHIIPGLRQSTPPDVMRGEETQIAGFLATHPGWDGVICLPGTHTKWAEVSAGEVVSFQTFMTGELFSLLGSQSVLRHSTASGWDQEAFDSGVSETLSRPETLAARLFRLRANDLLNNAPASDGRARLSGLLVGAELAAARPYWLGQQVAVIGAEAISAPYVAALALQGVTAQTTDATEMTLRGLSVAWSSLREIA